MRNKNLLLATVLSTAYAVLVFAYYQSSSLNSLGSILSVVLMLPSAMLQFIAALFGWMAIFASLPWAAAIGGALLCVSLFLAPWHIFLILFEGVEIVLMFTGYANLKDWLKNRESGELADSTPTGSVVDLSRTGVCERCGRLRQKSEVFSRYGLCSACNTKLRTVVTTDLDLVRAAVANPKLSPAEITQALERIDKLEQIRPIAPFFKSSTAEYRQALLAKQSCTK